MFERARAASARANEHLAAAHLLARNGLFAQAYAHVALALEESCVVGIRLVTESGVISWTDPPPWFRLREKDLSKGGSHPTKLRIGLLLSVVFAAANSLPTPTPEPSPTALSEELGRRMPLIADALGKLVAGPTLAGFFREGDQRKQAAFYSTSKAPGIAIDPPGEADYRALEQAVRPFVEAQSSEWPTEEQMARLAPAFREFGASMSRLLWERREEIWDRVSEALAREERSRREDTKQP